MEEDRECDILEECGGGGEGISCLHPGLLDRPPLRLGQGCLNALNFSQGYTHTHAFLLLAHTLLTLLGYPHP